jgi:hypothetical protein
MDNNKQIIDVEAANDLDFEILELTEATALEEMGASSTVGSGSTCSDKPQEV